MKCPHCDGDRFESNHGRVNYTLTYLCLGCGEQIDIGSCDGCGELAPIDLITDTPPHLCLACFERSQEKK